MTAFSAPVHEPIVEAARIVAGIEDEAVRTALKGVLEDLNNGVAKMVSAHDAAQSRLTRIEEAAQAYINAEHFVHNMLARDRSWPDEQEAMSSAWAQRKRTLKELKAALDTPSTPEETQP